MPSFGKGGNVRPDVGAREDADAAGLAKGWDSSQPEPFESTEAAVNRILNDTVKKRRDIYTKLPEIGVAASRSPVHDGHARVSPMTGEAWATYRRTRSGWCFVLRPRLRPCLSLPVYGENNQEEHESVLLGTKDKWLWDAWRDVAPTL